MPLFPRIDGTHIPARKLGAYRRLFAFLMDSRTESAVYFTRSVDMTDTLAWIAARKATGAGPAPSLFEIVMAATVRALALRPQLNRFVMGRRFYQRNSITLAFIVKKGFSEKAPMSNAKLDFDPHDTLGQVGKRLLAEIRTQRGRAKTLNEKEMDSLGYLPLPLLSAAIPLYKLLDRLGLVPPAMIRADPMYASAYVTNLGSIGLKDVPLHPLFNWGTASLFIAMGACQPQPVALPDGSLAVRQVLPLSFSLDNRVLDGLYASKAIQLLEHFITHPGELETAPVLDAEMLAELAVKPVPPCGDPGPRG